MSRTYIENFARFMNEGNIPAAEEILTHDFGTCIKSKILKRDDINYVVNGELQIGIIEKLFHYSDGKPILTYDLGEITPFCRRVGHLLNKTNHGPLLEIILWNLCPFMRIDIDVNLEPARYRADSCLNKIQWGIHDIENNESYEIDHFVPKGYVEKHYKDHPEYIHYFDCLCNLRLLKASVNRAYGDKVYITNTINNDIVSNGPKRAYNFYTGHIIQANNYAKFIVDKVIINQGLQN